MKKLFKKIAVSVLAILGTACCSAGVSACSPRSNNQAEMPATDISTDRLEVPADGSLPTDHTALENIAYMASVLDGQPFYHVYANNSTKSTGYEQITQTWKDYKSAEESGIGSSVMVCSDLSYSALVKSATQSCFIGNATAYMRNGGKPSKTSVPSDVSWSSDQPTYYDKQSYLYKYGEFSTELSVYIICESTVTGADGVVDNKDGTYSQKYYLNSEAASWYQYGMKTRGGLKTYPEFENIEITFTFDKNWQVLGSYCEEKTKIAPGALGGVQMTSTSKTTTVFDYSANGFDSAHYSYFDNYFKNYLNFTGNSSSGTAESEPELLDVLGNGFSNVVDANGNGQQFAIFLTIGDIDYSGKVYLKLGDMGDILGSLDARVSLCKEGSSQDLYAEFANGAVNLYYGNGFAMTADIGKVSESVGKITQFINSFDKKVDAQSVAYALTELQSEEESESGLDLNSVLNAIEMVSDSTSVCIKLKSNDLLGLGIGLNVQMYFDRSKDADGADVYSFSGLYLNSLSYGQQAINLSGTIVPDNKSPIISRNPSDTPADISDYIDGVLELLQSDVYRVDIQLDGTCKSISYIEGLTLQANAQIQLEDAFNKISVTLPVSVNYKGISADLDIYYTIDLSNGGYGDIYLHMTNLAGKAVDAKVYCNISEVVNTVKNLLGASNDGETSQTQGAKSTIADIVNMVLGIDFGAVITDLKANNESIKVTVNADEILSLLNVDFGVKFGEANLGVMLNEGKASLSGGLPALGLTIDVYGADGNISKPDVSEYANLTDYLNGVASLLNSNSYIVNISLDGSCQSISYIQGLELNANAQVQLENGFNKISVNSPVSVSYNGLTAQFTVYYTIDLNSSTYGEIYLDLTNLAGISADVKVYCDISDLKQAVEILISRFSASNEISLTSQEAEVLGDVVETVVNIDFAKIINELQADGEGISVSVNADEILKLLKKDLGFEIGNVNLGIAVNEDKLVLSGKLPSLGLSLGVSGSQSVITAPDKNQYADLTSYVKALNDLLDSKSYLLHIDLDGTCEIISYIEGLELQTTVQVQLENGFNIIKVNAPVTASYKGLTVKLEAYYTINLENGDYGEIYLTLQEINGVGFSARVYCNIAQLKTSIEELINLFNGSIEEEDNNAIAETTEKVSDIIAIVLDLDYASIVNELKADAGEIKLSLNVDELLSLFIEDVNLNAGNLDLSLTANGGKLSLAGSLPSLGLMAELSGCANGVTEPDKNIDYFDLEELVLTVKEAYLQADAIIKAQDIAFSLDGKVTIDGIEMTVDGNGEVIWKDGKIRVSVSADLTIADTNSMISSDSNNLALRLIYDETASSSQPLVRFAVNNLGLNISRDDINGVSDGIDGIKNAIGNITGMLSTEENIAVAGLSAFSEQPAMTGENLLNELFDYVLGVMSKVTVGISDKTLLLTYASNGSLSLGANGALTMGLIINDGGMKEIISLNASVCAGNGDNLSNLTQELDEGEYTFYNDENSFTKAVYNYIFDLFENLTVDKILGSNTYSVDLSIDGTQSGIEGLDGIKVNASLYYTNANSGYGKKLVEADLNLDIKGTVVTAIVYYTDYYVYVELLSVGGTELNDVAFKANVNNIYSVAETLVEMLKGDSLKGILSLLAPAQPATLSLADDSKAYAQAQSSSALSDILAKVLSFNFENVIKSVKEGDENVYTITPDSLIEAFGSDIKVGTITLRINPETHYITGTVANEETWLTLTAQSVSASSHGSFIPGDKFIDISFVSQLLEDIKVTLESMNGKILYSLEGDITANIKYSVINGSITLKGTNLTVGYDENDEFYFTLTASLDTNKANIKIGLNIPVANITTSGQISISYSNGLITLGRDGVYKVMTVNYLLDYMLDYTKKSAVSYTTESPIQWLLGTTPLAWGILCDQLGMNVSSGLTKPQTYEMYELATANNNSTFFLSSLLNGLAVKAKDTQTTYKTGENAVNKFNLSDNYYALDLNGNSLTGGVVPTLYAALLRGGDGINGVLAYAEVGGAVDLTVNLNRRAQTPAPNILAGLNVDTKYFDNAESDSVNHTTPVFGMYDSSTGTYTPSNMLDSVKLNVVELDGSITEHTLRYGSTVYLSSVFAPEWADENKNYTVSYKNAQGTVIGQDVKNSYDRVTGKMIVLDDSLLSGNYELTLYKVKDTVQSREVTYHIGVEGIENIYPAFNVNNGSVHLLRYDIEGYTLLGWYSDEACTNEITDEQASAFTGTDVYCKYAKSTVTVNGVIYTLHVDNGVLKYHVTGYDEIAIAPYTEDGSWLVLENSIIFNNIEYPVTEIEANAFAEAMLKNVVVPENVTVVRERAFLDNYNIQNVLFTADEVTVYGKSSDKNGIFYGCSVAEGGNTTSLNVYYNSITGENGWTYFRDTDKRIATSAGGSLTSTGWAYVVFVHSHSELQSLSGGLVRLSMTKEEIETAVMNELNEATSQNGYINAFGVSASGGYNTDGKLYRINVSIADASRYYKVTLSSNISGAHFDGTVVKYNGETYIMAGSSVIFNAPEGMEFTSISLTDAELNGDGSYTFTMPASTLDIDGQCAKATIKDVKIVSAIDFIYNNEIKAKGTHTLYGTNEGANLGEVSADGYYFLGWAYNNSNVLEFTSSTVQYGTYYAVWVEARDEITSVEALTSGQNPNGDISNVTVNTNVSAGFYKWYTDSSFTNLADSLSTSDTVLYGRVYYTLTVQYSLKSNMYIFYNNVDDSEKQVSKDAINSYTATEKILENDKFTVEDKEAKGVSYQIILASLNKEPLVYDIRVKNKTSITVWSSTTQPMTVEGCVVDKEEIMTGNMTITFNCTY